MNSPQFSQPRMFTQFFASTIIAILLIFPKFTESFPQGAPTDVCESFSPQRGHKAPSRSLSQVPFRLVQYGRHYRPGQMIGVEILPRDEQSREEALFKGFLVQALDANTFEFIGRFMPGEGLNLMPECSAVTHENNKPKSGAAFLWVPPSHHRGSREVIFRATIVQEKTIYYQNMLAEVLDE